MTPDDLTRELSITWFLLNETIFGGAMRGAPTIYLDEKLTHVLGEWNVVRHTIRMSQKFVMTASWLEVREVLKHEMAHEYVSEILGVADETAHGPAFRMICKRYGIDHRAAGRIGDEAPEARLAQKAQKLFALSKSSNRNEAGAALAALQRLRRRYSLSATAIRETDDGFTARALGQPAKVIEAHHLEVAAILARHFHVRPIWIEAIDPRTDAVGEQMEIVGRPQEVALAEYVHGWLHRTAADLCPKILKGKERVDYLLGVIRGFGETLSLEAGAIVKVDDDADLSEFFDRRYPGAKSSSGRGRRLSGAYFEGQAQGRTLKMKTPLEARDPKMLEK